MMDTKIIILVITSCTSLLVAIISIINSTLSNKQTLKSTKEIETLKFLLEKKNASENISLKYKQKDIEGIDLIIQTIQNVKDNLQLIIYSANKGLDADTAIEIIKESRQNFFRYYEEQLPHLNLSNIKGAHKAKNETLNIETLLIQFLKNKKYTSDLSNEQKNTLIEVRNRLTDFQNLLRDNKISIISILLDENN